MMDLIYIDTNIYLNLFQGESGRWHNFADLAVHLFNRVKNGEYTLVISDWVIQEFSKKRDAREIQKVIDDIPQSQIIHVKTTSQDKQKAREISSVNYPDALHVVLAMKSNAIYLVTRDADYQEFSNLIEIRFPEEL